MSRHSLQRPEKHGRRSVKLCSRVNLQTGRHKLPKAALGLAAIVSVAGLLLCPLACRKPHQGNKRGIEALHGPTFKRKRLRSSIFKLIAR
jgi:hypothetical protein